MAKSRGNTQTSLLSDPKDKKIEQLKKRIEVLEKQKANYKARYEKAKSEREEWQLKYKKLEKKKKVEGVVQDTSVKKLIVQFPALNQKLREFCKVWGPIDPSTNKPTGLVTRNNRNTCNLILALLEPDVNGVRPKYTEQDIIRFLEVLTKVGYNRYMHHPSLGTYYKLNDSVTLFKHYDAIRSIILEWLNPTASSAEEVGGRMKYATLNGKTIEPKVQTIVCSWEDYLNQQRGVVHPNDSLEISKFKGDDLIRERERRSIAKVGGKPDRKIVEDIMKFQSSQSSEPKDEFEDIINKTEIKEIRY